MARCLASGLSGGGPLLVVPRPGRPGGGKQPQPAGPWLRWPEWRVGMLVGRGTWGIERYEVTGRAAEPSCAILSCLRYVYVC